MLQYLNIDSIPTFPVTLATPSFSCERSADEKLPEASEWRIRKNKMHTMINLDKKSRVLPQGKDSIELQLFQVNSKMISSIKNN